MPWLNLHAQDGEHPDNSFVLLWVSDPSVVPRPPQGEIIESVFCPVAAACGLTCHTHSGDRRDISRKAGEARIWLSAIDMVESSARISRAYCVTETKSR